MKKQIKILELILKILIKKNVAIFKNKNKNLIILSFFILNNIFYKYLFTI